MYLIGFFSRRQKFHIVEQRDTMEEVEAYLNNHGYGHFNKLVVFQQISRPTQHAADLPKAERNSQTISESSDYVPRPVREVA